MVSFIDKLNPEQKAAVTLPAESALILAGAGSGKTRVLTTRIAWLIEQSMASPLEILAVTFTNKAAKEMLTRIQASIPVNTRGMWVGHFMDFATVCSDATLRKRACHRHSKFWIKPISSPRLND